MRNGISPGVRRSRVERRVGNMNSELRKLPGGGKVCMIFSRKRQKSTRYEVKGTK